LEGKGGLLLCERAWWQSLLLAADHNEDLARPTSHDTAAHLLDACEERVSVCCRYLAVVLCRRQHVYMSMMMHGMVLGPILSHDRVPCVCVLCSCSQDTKAHTHGHWVTHLVDTVRRRVARAVSTYAHRRRGPSRYHWWVVVASEVASMVAPVEWSLVCRRLMGRTGWNQGRRERDEDASDETAPSPRLGVMTCRAWGCNVAAPCCGG
jgi:hypothetical protein